VLHAQAQNLKKKKSVASSERELVSVESAAYNRFPLPEFAGRVNSGAFFDTHELGPSWRVSKIAPELTGHQLGPWTRVVETGL